MPLQKTTTGTFYLSDVGKTGRERILLIQRWIIRNNEIFIAHEVQEKTTFTFMYDTYEFKRMSFGLCNAAVTFLGCMMTILHGMVENFVEVFMEDFSVFGESFEICLTNHERVLAKCDETNLVFH